VTLILSYSPELFLCCIRKWAGGLRIKGGKFGEGTWDTHSYRENAQEAEMEEGRS
jgi:hypothetical protein